MAATTSRPTRKANSRPPSDVCPEFLAKLRRAAVKQVEVTADDIARGIPGDLANCPFGTAIVRALASDPIAPRFVEIELGRVDYFAVFGPRDFTSNARGSHALPPAVGEAFDRFHRGLPVEPVAFEIDLMR